MYSILLVLQSDESQEWILSPIRKVSNGSWIDKNNGKVVDMEGIWYPGEPNGGDLQDCTTYFTLDSKHSDVHCNDMYPYVCAWKGTTLFTLRGLCARSNVVEQFVLLPKETYDGNIFFYGIGNNNIIYNKETNSWLIVENRAKELFENVVEFGSLKIVGSYLLDKDEDNVTPVGTHVWNLTDGCHKDLPLKLTHVRSLIFSKIVHEY